MRQVLIIADDLSGAADCGIAFTSSSLRATVVFGSQPEDLDVDVLSVDADTRCLSPQAAAEQTRILMRRFGQKEQLVFKKVDSTLRGNVGAELMTVLESQRSFNSGREHTVVLLAPAFPAQGRTTFQGRQFLHGKFLEKTELWKREGRQDRAHIPEILETAGLRAGRIGLEVVRSKNHSLSIAMLALTGESDVLVCDAETDDDLRAIAEAGVALGGSTVWAGSAGLAYHLPKAAGLAPFRVADAQQALATGPTLCVIGSMTSVSREQTRVLTESSGAIAISIPLSDLRMKAEGQEHLGSEIAISRALQSGNDVVVSIGLEDREPEPKPGAMPGGSQGKLLSSALAQMVQPHAEKIGALVASGGETALAVLRAWGVSALRLIGELEPGVPFSVAENWRRPLPVLTKAGDFGNPQTLLHCQQFLRGPDRAQTANLYHRRGL